MRTSLGETQRLPVGALAEHGGHEGEVCLTRRRKEIPEEFVIQSERNADSRNTPGFVHVDEPQLVRLHRVGGDGDAFDHVLVVREGQVHNAHHCGHSRVIAPQRDQIAVLRRRDVHVDVEDDGRNAD